jgi:hypothetical protein
MEMVDRIVRACEPNKEAGRSLGMSPRTVETHRRAIYERLGVWNIAELCLLVHTGRRVGDSVPEPEPAIDERCTEAEAPGACEVCGSGWHTTAQHLESPPTSSARLEGAAMIGEPTCVREHFDDTKPSATCAAV